MSSIKKRDFFSETSSFIHKHKVLCIATLGLAIAIYGVGNLGGRLVAWVGESKGTTQKTEKVAKTKFSEPLAVEQEVGVVPALKLDAKKSFSDFTKELEKEIFPFYVEHEKSFDTERIHGRMHVARAVIFAEVMARYYQTKGKSIDFDSIRRITGLHDAGRKQNGEDFWEKESAELLYKHLISKNVPHKKALKKAQLIVKNEAHQNSIEFKIFQSADCLDIMRPCTGNGGRAGFKPKYLTFLKNGSPKDLQFRQKLISEAWLFIQITEKQKMTEFNESEGFMGKLFEIISQNKEQLPILSSLKL